MTNTLVSHSIEEKPTLVWILADASWQSGLSLTTFGQNFSHEFVYLSDLKADPDKNQIINRAYKVILFLLPSQIFQYQAELGRVAQEINKQAVIIVLPWAARISSSALTNWQHANDLAAYYGFQRQILQHIVSLLPNSQIVLVEELFWGANPWLVPTTFYYLLTSINSLEFTVCLGLPQPLPVQNMLNFLLDLAARPHKPRSYILHTRQAAAKSTVGQSWLNKIGDLYQQMYQVELKTNDLGSLQIERPSLISEEKVVDNTNLSSIVTAVTQALPSPTQNAPDVNWLSPPPAQRDNFHEQRLEKTAKITSLDKDISHHREDESTQISHDIQHIFRSERVEQKKRVVKDLAKQELVFRDKRRRRKRLFYGGVSFIGIGLGVLFLISVFLFSERRARNVFTQVLVRSAQQQGVSPADWDQLKSRVEFLDWQAQSYLALFDSDLFAQAVSLNQVSQTLIGASQSLVSANDSLQILAETMLSMKDESVSNQAQNSLLEVQGAYAQLARLQSELATGAWGEIGDQSPIVEDWLAARQKNLITAQRVIPILHSISALPGRQRWVLLFQNDQELRPTGGFIQAIAVITSDKGKWLSHQTYSSYQIDALLPGSVLPPDEIGRFLGEDRWYFRDSNWDPHFPSAATRVLWFVDKALQADSLGVIALTPNSLAEIIDVVGPIELPEFNEVVTKDNLRERLEFHSSVQIDPNDQKADYSALLLERVLDAMLSVPSKSLSQLTKALQSGLTTQEIQMYVTNSEIQSSFSALGWTGELLTPSCPSQFVSADCQIDTVAQIEANIGVNKANAYLNRDIVHTVDLNKEKALHIRQITYSNTARTAAWPKGPYQAYVRFYLPEEAALESVMIGGSRLSATDLVRQQEHSRQVVGLRINVPVGEQQSLEIIYTTPHQISTGSAYLIFDQKQSGGGENTEKLVINYPTDMTPSLIAPQGEILPGKVTFQIDSTTHSFSGIQF